MVALQFCLQEACFFHKGPDLRTNLIDINAQTANSSKSGCILKLVIKLMLYDNNLTHI